MSQRTIWDFWAPRYHRLWAQKFSLTPTRQMVRQHLQRVATDARSILDAGCGTGQLLGELAAADSKLNLYGFDPSSAMLQQARQHNSADNIDYRLGTLEQEERGPFDVVVLTHAFPYVEDHRGAAQKIRSLLNPNGRALVVQGNCENMYDKIFFAFVELTTTRASYYSAAELWQIFGGAGFARGVVETFAKPFWMPSIQMCEFIVEEPGA